MCGKATQPSQTADNNAMRDNLEELLLEINDITGDIDMNDATKFNNVRKLKLQQFLRAAPNSNYES